MLYYPLYDKLILAQNNSFMDTALTIELQAH